MWSRRVLVFAAVLVAVVALGAAATAIQDTDSATSGDAGDESGQPDVVPTDLIPFVTIPGWVFVTVVFTLVVIAVVGLVVLPEERRRFARNMAAVLVVCLLVLLAADALDPAFLDANPEETNATEGSGDGDGAGEGGQTEGSGDSETRTSPFVSFLALLAAGTLGAILVSWLLVRGADGADTGTAEPDTTRREAVGRAAGRAADRIETDSLENGVYRAWLDMTEAVQVSNPDSRTPSEFRRAAIEAGLDRDDVEALTALFREVRYGEAQATTDRERRARETLRRIEETYADSAGDGGERP